MQSSTNISLQFRALEGLKQSLPFALRNGTFDTVLQEDPMTAKFAMELLVRVSLVSSE